MKKLVTPTVLKFDATIPTSTYENMFSLRKKIFNL